VTATGNVAAAENVLVAVAVSTTGALNVLVTTVSASVAVAVSTTGALNVLDATASESVAVAVSDIDAKKTFPPSDENGACENADKPNTRHAPLILSYCQISFSKPTLLGVTINISPLNQTEDITIFIHTHCQHRALWHHSGQLYGIAFFKCCHD
jgi:hypothetical protein